MKKSILVLLGLILFSAILFSQEESTEKPFPALLVIDVQNKYLPMMSQEDQGNALEMMNWAIYVFRQYELPVIRIYHTSEKWGPEPGSDEFQFHESLKVEETDPMIIKTYGSAFNKTELDSMLKDMGVNTLYMCGLSSVGCVMASYFDAGNYDYKAFLIKDAMLGPDAHHTDMIEEMFDAISLNTANYILQFSEMSRK
jgi:nicotinamidase-related amidase